MMKDELPELLSTDCCEWVLDCDPYGVERAGDKVCDT